MSSAGEPRCLVGQACQHASRDPGVQGYRMCRSATRIPTDMKPCRYSFPRQNGHSLKNRRRRQLRRIHIFRFHTYRNIVWHSGRRTGGVASTANHIILASGGVGNSVVRSVVGPELFFPLDLLQVSLYGWPYLTLYCYDQDISWCDDRRGRCAA